MMNRDEIKSVITNISFLVPEQEISNEELVESYNQFVEQHNLKHPDSQIQKSSSKFIYQASGIKKRYTHDKQGILDINKMSPSILNRSKEALSFQAEFAVKACEKLKEQSGDDLHDVNAVIISCSNFERAYPGIGVEVKQALNIENAFAIDVNSGCASAVYGIALADSFIQSKMALKVLVVTPELYTFHMNFKDRKSHFIFGDGCSAVLIESYQENKKGFIIKNKLLESEFSNNIRNDLGFINKHRFHEPQMLFNQVGENVRKEIVPKTIDHIKKHLKKYGINENLISKLWLHQANSLMLKKIGLGIFGGIKEASIKVPITIHKYANTGGSSVIGCMQDHNFYLNSGDFGMLCGFGTGYHIGSILVEKV